jgi:2-dehydro-3-deoxyphosphooctonate aldolase (KDO 8-P synthase)
MNQVLQPLFKETSYDPESFFLIAGPCVVEGEENMHQIASTVKEICTRLGIPYIFKASYRKANRTSSNSFTGLGDDEAMALIRQIKSTYQLPVTTAFLCRQTDLLEAAAATGKIVNIKKGQFLSGPSMKFATEKVKNAGNEKVMLTERGNTFGYQDLVVDYRNIAWMKEIDVPVIMDCTHSLQQPNQTGGVTGGNPGMITTIASAAIASGADGLFIETHPNPAAAKSDGANMLRLDLLEELLQKLIRIRKAVLG